MLTDAELAAIRARSEAAWAMVTALCAPRGTRGAREWMMSIPARRDYDPDLVIGDSLADVSRLLSDLEALLAEPTEAQVEVVARAMHVAWFEHSALGIAWELLPDEDQGAYGLAARAAIKAWQGVSRG